MCVWRGDSGLKNSSMELAVIFTSRSSQTFHLKFLRIQLTNLKTDYTTMISMPNPSFLSA